MIKPVNEIFLLLGANLGDRKQTLEQVVSMIEDQIGKVVIQSSLYETEAWGNILQPAFLNQVIKVESPLNSLQVLEKVLLIEQKTGRIRTFKNAPRIIDIDILFFNKDVITFPKLKIPHPEIQNRNFVLKPLAEVAPFYLHPVLNKNINELLNDCKDHLKVEKLATR